MMFNYGSGVSQRENGMGTANMFAAPDPASQGQYNPLELLMNLLKKKQNQMPAPQMQNMLPMQMPNQAGVNFPNFNQGMMPQGALSPNGQIMPNFKGLLG